MVINMKSYAEQFYKSKRWQKCRNEFMGYKHYTCEICGGCATIAHHKIHINPVNINNPDITLNWNNLQALCQTCHNKIHGKGKSKIIDNGFKFDGNGNIVRATKSKAKF